MSNGWPFLAEFTKLYPWTVVGYGANGEPKLRWPRSDISPAAFFQALRLSSYSHWWPTEQERKERIMRFMTMTREEIDVWLTWDVLGGRPR